MTKFIKVETIGQQNGARIKDDVFVAVDQIVAVTPVRMVPEVKTVIITNGGTQFATSLTVSDVMNRIDEAIVNDMIVRKAGA